MVYKKETIPVKPNGIMMALYGHLFSSMEYGHP